MLAKSSAAAEYYTAATSNEKHAWKGGVLRRMPWKGLFALLGALVCILVAIAILAYSDGKAIASWKFSPSVYVSIAYTIGNVLLENALARGITISWWRKAIRDGTTLGDLHRYWDFGGTWGALQSGRHFNYVAFACLFLSIAPINGPLLQRSSEVELRQTESTTSITIQAAKKIDFPTGYLSGRLFLVPLLSEDFSSVFQSYQAGKSISANHTGCSGDGKCYGHISAAGLAVNCSSYTVPYHLTPPPGCNSLVQNSQECIDAETGQLNLDVQYKDQSACDGDMMIKNCTLRAARVRYPVVIDGNSSTISIDPKSSIFDDSLEEMIKHEEADVQGTTELGGFGKALSEMFYGVSYIRYAGSIGYESMAHAPAGAQFANLTEVLKTPDGINQGLCNIFFNDPVPYFLEQARQLMFRTALTGSSNSPMQTAEFVQVVSTAVYQSNYAYLGAAAAVSLLAVLIVLITYNGYWLLGRRVTMSPIEVAKAFNAPVLGPEHPNAEVDELVKDAGKKPVQYGVAHGDGGQYSGPLHVPGEEYSGVKLVADVHMRGVVPEPGGGMNMNMNLAIGAPSQVQALISR